MPDNFYSPQDKQKLEYYSEQGFYEDETPHDWMQHNAVRFADVPAVISADSILSYAELIRQVKQFFAPSVWVITRT